MRARAGSTKRWSRREDRSHDFLLRALIVERSESMRMIMKTQVLVTCLVALSSALACGNGKSESSSGAVDAGRTDAEAIHCENVPFTQFVHTTCDQCVHVNCCPELVACAKASPLCPQLCAGGSPYSDGCADVFDLANAMRRCADNKCKQECFPDCTKLPCSHTGNTTGGSGGTGGAGSTSGAGG